jgi:hypothetical protein
MRNVGISIANVVPGAANRDDSSAIVFESYVPTSMAADEFRFSQLMTANEAENIAPPTSEEDVVRDVGDGKYCTMQQRDMECRRSGATTCKQTVENREEASNHLLHRFRRTKREKNALRRNQYRSTWYQEQRKKLVL